MLLRALVFASIVVLVGCPAEPGLDGGLTPADAGASDAGQQTDSGVVTADAGREADSGLPFTDAGGGALDAGAMNDAGVGLDSGVPLGDAGVKGPVQLSLALSRDGGDVIAWVTAVNGVDAGQAGLAVSIAANGVALAVTDLGAGRYQATATPTVTSGELPIVATLGAGTVSKVAVVLPTIDPAWGQPERVDGLVNTPGTEDSATVSPDGQWLIVGTYSPIDILACVQKLGTGPNDGRNSACQTSTGPSTGPSRPRMPGASRVVSPTRIINVAPNLCLDNPDGGDFAFPLSDGGVLVLTLAPVVAYGFARQPDGTFATPFVIAFDEDGISSSCCFTFVGAPVGGVARLLYGNKRYDVLNDTTRPWVTQIALGADATLGAYQCVAGSAQLTLRNTYVLPVTPLNQTAGNTSIANDWLVSDDETVDPAITVAAHLTDAGVTPWQAMPLPEVGDDRRQPVLEGGRIFYYRNATIASTPWLSTAPTSRSSFGAPRVELAGELLPQGPLPAAPGRVVGLGQPTFAHLADGTTELYFVYYLRTSTGYDSQIGRVLQR